VSLSTVFVFLLTWRSQCCFFRFSSRLPLRFNTRAAHGVRSVETREKKRKKPKKIKKNANFCFKFLTFLVVFRVVSRSAAVNASTYTATGTVSVFDNSTGAYFLLTGAKVPLFTFFTNASQRRKKTRKLQIFSFFFTFSLLTNFHLQALRF
jgi:hypothetical protein